MKQANTTSEDELRQQVISAVFGHHGVSVGAPAHITKMVDDIMSVLTSARLGELEWLLELIGDLNLPRTEAAIEERMAKLKGASDEQ